MLDFVIGGAGFGKSYYLMEKIKKIIGKKDKLLVIVPEQFSFEYDRKLYKMLGAADFNRISVFSFTRLAQTIFESFGGRSGKYADDNTKTVLMYRAVAELNKRKSFLALGRQAKNMSFTEQSLNLVTDLRKAGLSPESIINKTETLNGQVRDKITDIYMIYSVYDKIMKESGLKDSLNDISESAQLAAVNNFFGGYSVFLDEFDGFTGDEYEMLDVLVSQAENVSVALRTDGENSGEFSLFASVNRTLGSLRLIAERYDIECGSILMDKPFRYKNNELVHLNANIMRSRRKICAECENISAFEAKELYQEADFVCAEIRRLVMDEGYSFKDFAVVSRQLNEYGGIFEAAFRRYEIPYYMDLKKGAAHSSVMVLTVGALELAGTGSPNTEAVLRYAKTDLLGIKFREIAMLENYCYKWDIKGTMWYKSFENSADSMSTEIEKIRKQLIEPIARLREACKKASGLEICRVLYDFYEEVDVQRNINGLTFFYKESGYPEIGKDIKRLWGSLMDMLDVIASVIGDTPVTIKEFSGLLSAMLKQSNYSNPPQSLDIVSVVSAERARLDTTKVTFLIGANEGLFPLASKASGLLSEKDLHELEAAGIEITKSSKQLLADEMLIAYKMLSSPSERLYITYPLSDNSGGARYPSYIVEQICGMYGRRIRKTAADYGPVFFSPTINTAYHTYVQGFNRKSSDYLSIRQVLREDGVYSSRLEYLDIVNENRDFRINDKGLLEELMGRRLSISATSFEDFNKCHFQYFCKKGLGIFPREKKEVNSLEFGNLIHLCLERIFSSCKSKEELEALNEAEIKKLSADYAREYRDEVFGGDFGKTARFEANFSRITENITDLVMHIKEELSQSKFMPVNFELKISEGGGHRPIRLTTQSGIDIILSGKIDRVDMFEENGERFIRVIDYKTGAKKISVANLLFGIDMQMFIYLFSITGNSGLYSGAVPAGVLYMPSGSLSCERERGAEDTLEDFINSTYKMNGVVLNERSVLTAMEEDIRGVYIPAALLKSDSGEGEVKLNEKSSSYFTRKQFANLRRYSKRLIEEMAESFFDGDISASPLQGFNACEYCSYWDVCGNVPNIRSRSVGEDAKDRMKQILDAEEAE